MAIKKCPFCAEEIQEEALICRFCHSKLAEDDMVSSVPNNIPSQNTNMVLSQPDAIKPPSKGLSITALILGILGGLAGIGGAVFALFFGGLGSAFGAQGAESVIGLGWAAIGFSLFGTVGAAISIAKPKAAGIIMLISAVGGTICISMAYIIAGPLLLIAGILDLISSKNQAANQPFDESSIKLPFWKRPWVLAGSGAVLVFAVLIIIGINSDASKSSKDALQQDPYNYSVNVEEVGNVKGVKVSDVGFAILSVERNTVLEDEYDSIDAQGEFIIVELGIENFQKDAITVDANSFVLLDDSGNEYSYSVDASLIEPYEGFFLDSLNPGMFKSGYLVFDVPKGLNLKLQVQGGMTGETATLPLKVMFVDKKDAAQAGKELPTTTEEEASNLSTQDTFTPDQALTLVQQANPGVPVEYQEDSTLYSGDDTYYCFWVMEVENSEAAVVYVSQSTGEFYYDNGDPEQETDAANLVPFENY